MRDSAGRFKIVKSSLSRFAEKCQFDPTTGCVLWTGGTSAGRGNTARYGVFWDEGARWFAHRWSAVNIHGIALGENQAGHCCPHGSNTLCIQHVKAQTQLENLEELNGRLKARQTAQERQFYLFVQLGIEPPPAPPPEIDSDAVPFYEPPEWLRPFLQSPENDDDCPF